MSRRVFVVTVEVDDGPQMTQLDVRHAVVNVAARQHSNRWIQVGAREVDAEQVEGLLP